MSLQEGRHAPSRESSHVEHLGRGVLLSSNTTTSADRPEIPCAASNAKVFGRPESRSPENHDTPEWVALEEWRAWAAIV